MLILVYWSITWDPPNPGIWEVSDRVYVMLCVNLLLPLRPLDPCGIGTEWCNDPTDLLGGSGMASDGLNRSIWTVLRGLVTTVEVVTEAPLVFRVYQWTCPLGRSRIGV